MSIRSRVEVLLEMMLHLKKVLPLGAILHVESFSGIVVKSVLSPFFSLPVTPLSIFHLLHQSNQYISVIIIAEYKTMPFLIPKRRPGRSQKKSIFIYGGIDKPKNFWGTFEKSP